jgi:hypothetical protein
MFTEVVGSLPEALSLKARTEVDRVEDVGVPVVHT